MNDFIAWLHQQLAQRVAAPRYIQLAATIEMAIKQQVLAVKDFLPSERQMAEELALSRVTVSKAMKLLQEKALISRQQGVGTQVAMHNGYPFSLDSSFTPTAASAMSGCCALVCPLQPILRRPWIWRVTPS